MNYKINYIEGWMVFIMLAFDFIASKVSSDKITF